MSWYNVLNVFTFACYAFLLWMNCNREENYYTNQRLFSTVIFYSLIFVGLYMIISYYYRENTFLFSEVDAKKYEKYSFALLDIPIKLWCVFLEKHNWGFDDWGAPISQTLALHVVESKMFVNFCYVLLNTFGAVLLFEIGKLIMQKNYAYLAALAYATASYSIFFMGSYLKESIMSFILIATMFYLYRYWEDHRPRYIVAGVITSLLLLLFRVPVALFVWAAYGSLLVLNNKGKVRMIMVVIVGIIIVIAALGLILDSATRYANDGNMSESYNYLTYSQSQKLVLYISALIGPFPQLLQAGYILTEKSLYGAGLLFKLIIAYPFWRGCVLCIKTKDVRLNPILTFTILEMMALGLVLDSLELRKAMPHVPFFILAAFWYMSQFDENADDEVCVTPYYKRVKIEYIIWIAFVFMIGLVWNMFRK